MGYLKEKVREVEIMQNINLHSQGEEQKNRIAVAKEKLSC